MPWRGHDALRCKICGGYRDEVGPLSARYKCASCGKKHQRENVDQLRAQRGTYFKAWRRGMYTSTVEWLAQTGRVSEEQRQLLLDDFDERSLILARYDPTRTETDPIVTKKVGRRLPAIATQRQRQVGAELRQHYREAQGNLAQGIFLLAMNMQMQSGTPRLEAEKHATDLVRERLPDFTPLHT